MDVPELRHAFTESEAMPQRLRRFHEVAVTGANGTDMPFTMDLLPAVVFSIMPLGILRERHDLALTRENTILPVDMSGGVSLPTMEGILWYTPPNEATVTSYTLTHRTGRIDAAFTIGGVRNIRGEDKLIVWPGAFEDGVAELGTSGMARLKSYGLEGPWVIAVTLLRMKGAVVLNDISASRPAWRQQVHLPELVLEHVSQENLRPLHEAFWLLFGLTRQIRNKRHF